MPISVFWRYWLLQVPGWVVLGSALVAARHYFGLPSVWAFAIFGVWLVKDAAIYPWLRRHYELRNDDAGDALRGRLGVAQERLAPRGYVKLGGELWRAEIEEGESPIVPGEHVVVEAVDGLTLRVRRRDGVSD